LASKTFCFSTVFLTGSTSHPGTLPFASISTGLKTDPGAFRFCQIEPIFQRFSSQHGSAVNRRQNAAKKEGGAATGHHRPFFPSFNKQD
jgi:hypothetical protein